MTTIAENIQTLRSIKSDIKNAITDKGGSVGNDFKTYAQAITNLPSGGGGGTEIEDALVTGTISEYSNDRVSVVGDYAFYSFKNLTSVNLPNCISVGLNAFAYCDSLTYVNLLSCKSLMDSTFYNNFRLRSIRLPICSYIGAQAFAFCQALTSVNLPLCKSFGSNFFGTCSVFVYCKLLSIVKIPLCSYIGDGTFLNCSNLREVYLNSVSSVATIFSETFYSCSNLTSIYVPASLVNAFKIAEYWSSISDKIVAYTGA